MKYSILILLVTGVSSSYATRFDSWQEHAIAGMQAQQAAANRGGLNVVTVGSDNSCDYRLGNTKIQDALDDVVADGIDEIRIVNDTYGENLEIADFSVALKGGYANCTDAANGVVTPGVATVDGDESGVNAPALIITGNTQRNTVIIEDMTFTDGNGVGFTSGGGISALNADLQLNLNRVNLSGNTGILGGGLAVLVGNTDVNADNVLVSVNSADAGGGIYCSGSDNSILISSSENRGGVFLNSAVDGDGGGALLDSGCTLTSFSGTKAGGFDFRGFVSNTATENGGGIAVRSGSTLTLAGFQFCLFSCIGDNDNPINIVNNSANDNDDGLGNGGGIYATGENTQVSASTVDIANNRARNGGAVSIEDMATFTTSYPIKACWSPGKCNQIRNNEATTAGGGSYLTTGGSAEIAQTYIQGNRADAGTALYAIDATTPTRYDVEGSVITGNGNNGGDGFNDINAVRIFGDQATAEMRFVTIADNDLGGDSLGGSGNITIWYSIVHDEGTDVYDESGSLSRFCMVVNEDATVVAGSNIIVDDPEFVDRAGGDYHINAMTSPAVDLCQESFFPSEFTDIDLEARGFDDATPNFQGPWDAGADETYTNDIIFADDFDS